MHLLRVAEGDREIVDHEDHPLCPVEVVHPEVRQLAAQVPEVQIECFTLPPTFDASRHPCDRDLLIVEELCGQVLLMHFCVPFE